MSASQPQVGDDGPVKQQMSDTAVKIGLRVRESGGGKEGIVTDVWRDDRNHWMVEINAGTSYPLGDIMPK